MTRIMPCGNPFSNEQTKYTDMIVNPFGITKAVDFTDEEIDKYWTNIHEKGGFMDLLKPWSLMPIIIKGSKGSGKTHVMRYFSFELQKIRYGNNLKAGLDKEKFLGVYIRCSGFNHNKFSGKGLSDEQWEIIYHSFWELWVGERVCRQLSELRELNIISEDDERKIVNEIMGKLPNNLIINRATLNEVCDLFKDLQKDIDFEIQNFLFRIDKTPYFRCLVPTPTLTFGIPNILHECIEFFKDKHIMYLIDELENFSEREQQLVQIILREKPTSCTVRVGTRPYGIRTLYILNAIEENRIGSEFELESLDDYLRTSKYYPDFIRGLCNKRLEIHGYGDVDITNYIEEAPRTVVLNKICSKKASQGRGYINTLKNHLDSIKMPDNTIDEIIKKLQFKEDIIIERVNYMIFYRRWKEGKIADLLKVATLIGEEAELFYKTKNKASEHSKIIEKYRGDIVDTLAREGREKQPNWGFERLVALSCGTPRNILNVLKNAFIHETYYDGNPPFKDGRLLSIESQMVGVKNTVDWFYQENRILSPSSKRITESISRLGEYLRMLRFSDIPPQCSINIFSLKKKLMSDEAQKVFNILVDYSYIIKVSDRRMKNSDEMQDVFQINTSIMPQWELAIGMRGLVEVEEILADFIFELNQQENYEKVVKQKRKLYNAPFVNDTTPQLNFME